MRRSYTHTFSFEDALDWQLHKTSLRWELTDRAERAATQQHPGFYERDDVDTEVTVEEDMFVVVFTWDDEG